MRAYQLHTVELMNAVAARAVDSLGKPAVKMVVLEFADRLGNIPEKSRDAFIRRIHEETEKANSAPASAFDPLTLSLAKAVILLHAPQRHLVCECCGALATLVSNTITHEAECPVLAAQKIFASAALEQEAR